MIKGRIIAKNNSVSSFNIYMFMFVFVAYFITANAQPVTTSVKHPAWSYNQTIYEVNIRQFSKEGTFKAFQKHLPELKKMGVGIIWLMPINPIGEKNRKGTLGSYYSVKDYLAVNPDFGTKDDLKELIREIHKQGMHVIIDWVANHTAWDNKLAIEHPDWYTKDSLGNFVPPVADWSDVIDLNYDNKGLRAYMINALKYWVKGFNIDGYRCDVAGMVPTDFWNDARKELDKIKPVFMLAEAESPELQEKAFDMTYSWELLHIINELAKGKKNVHDVINYFKKERSLYPKDAFRMRFTTNHDENTWNGTVFERLGDAVETMAVFTVAIPGMPLLYNGQEAGLNKRLAFFEKDPIEWKKSKLRELYTKLFNLKMNNKALRNGAEGGNVILVSNPDDKDVYSFVREKDNDKIFVIFNLSNKQVASKLTGDKMKGDYKNLFTGEKISFSSSEKIELEPWEYRFYVK